MSKKIKEKAIELASRESEIKKKLFGKSGELKSKANRLGKTALIGGGIALVIFGLYKAFFQGEAKPKKNRGPDKSVSGIIAEKITVFILPYLGKILDNLFDNKQENSKETEEKTDPKTEF